MAKKQKKDKADKKVDIAQQSVPETPPDNIQPPPN